MFCKERREAWTAAHLSAARFTDYLKATVETSCSEKMPFEILQLTDNGPGPPRDLMEMCNEMNIAFLPGNAASVLQPGDQGVILAFKPHYLRNKFHKAVAVIHNVSLMDLAKMNRQLSGKDSSF